MTGARLPEMFGEKIVPGVVRKPEWVLVTSAISNGDTKLHFVEHHHGPGIGFCFCFHCSSLVISAISKVGMIPSLITIFIFYGTICHESFGVLF